MFLRFLKRRTEDEGFTLIELMVVVLIIGILVAIALPTFLGARNRANDKAAESSLRNAIAAAKTCFTDQDSYTPCTAAILGGVEPSLTWQAAASTGPNIISFSVPVAGAGTEWDAAALSKTGTCWWIKDVSAGGAGVAGTFYGSGAACAGTDAAAAAGASW